MRRKGDIRRTSRWQFEFFGYGMPVWLPWVLALDCRGRGRGREQLTLPPSIDFITLSRSTTLSVSVSGAIVMTSVYVSSVLGKELSCWLVVRFMNVAMQV